MQAFPHLGDGVGALSTEGHGTNATVKDGCGIISAKRGEALGGLNRERFGVIGFAIGATVIESF